MDGGGLVCQVGNTGDGIVLIGNNAKLANASVFLAGGDGIRVGTTGGVNCDAFELNRCSSKSNIGRGIYVHDDNGITAADCNVGTLYMCEASLNGGDGILMGHGWWNNLIGCIGEGNGGWGLNLSSTIRGTVAECRGANIYGGDFEGNSGISPGVGQANIAGYGCSVYAGDNNIVWTIVGVLCNLFGQGASSQLSGLKIRNGGPFEATGNIAQTLANGQALNVLTQTEVMTIAASASSNSASPIPGGAIILGISVRVTAAVTCTTNFTVGDAGSATRYSTGAVSKALNSTDRGTKAGAYYNASNTAIVITPDTTPSDNTGRVRTTIHYIQIDPPTS
jgi:hypothetical protein